MSASAWILGIVAVATGAWAWYDYRLPPGPPTAASQRRAALILAHATVNAVEAHRQANGVLPEDLSILDLSRGDWSYIRADTGYTLVLTLHDVVLVYRSGDDHQAFLDQAGVR